MKDADAQVVIAGGGMVGVSLALQLHALLPPSARIVLVESAALPPAGTAPLFHPSFDARSTALSYSSYRIYDDLGVWQSLAERACPIEHIHVSSRGQFGSTLLHAQEYQWPALGYVVENGWLGTRLLAALRDTAVELRSPSRLLRATPADSGVALTLDGDGPQTLHAGLLIVADGAESSLRQSLGVAVAEKSYGQQAIIANVSSARAHGGVAYERFTEQGPLALLPLPDHDHSHRSALVWSLPPQRAEALLAATDEAFLSHLQQRFGYRLGRLQSVGERASYPLKLVQAHEQVRSNIVIMGNAAHALHPVAGQGFNLALRDVRALAGELAGAAQRGEAMGELGVLQRYQLRQQQDQARTVALSDQLPGLFMRSDPLLSLGRTLGLAGLDLSAAARREFVQQAAGVAALAGSPRA